MITKTIITLILEAAACICLIGIQNMCLTLYGLDLSTFIICVIIYYRTKNTRQWLFSNTDSVAGNRAPYVEDPSKPSPNTVLIEAIKEAAEWPKNISEADKKTLTYDECQHKAIVAIYEKFKI